MRIAKNDVVKALQTAALNIKEAAGPDGIVSRADMKEALTGLEGTEKRLTDVFFKFVDHRDFRAGARVTAKDVDKAVAYARTAMIAKYDLNANGLSKAEIAEMSLTGKLAVRLARELKAAAVKPRE